MTTQTSVQQRAAPSVGQVDLPASHGAPQGERDGQENINTAKVASISLLVAGAAIIVTVFAAGFMRTRVERGLGRLFSRIADSAAEIEVPLVLPLTIAETIREVLAGRRVMEPPSGEQPAMN